MNPSMEKLCFLVICVSDIRRISILFYFRKHFTSKVCCDSPFAFHRQIFARKLTLHKALILAVLLYGAEAWTLASTNAAALGVFERKGCARFLLQ